MRILTKAQEQREKEERDELFMRKLKFLAHKVHQLTVCDWKDQVGEHGEMRSRGFEIHQMAEDVLYADDVIV